VATCLDYLTDIPLELQKPGRFMKNIAIPTPDASARREIIRSFAPAFAPEHVDKYIADLADCTHAYTGQDLSKVIGLMSEACDQRTGNLTEPEFVSWQDVQRALEDVQPTAMHDINLKPPTVRWTDIGGYEHVKIALQQAIRPPMVSDYNPPSPFPPLPQNPRQQEPFFTKPPSRNRRTGRRTWPWRPRACSCTARRGAPRR
jgi:AAA family ATPase